MKDAIEIFEAAHPNKQALFIFDQSSAHASLPPDALKAFDMNKSDGGKQRFQNQPSMLETLIMKAGHECIFLPKFHCELNPIEMVSIQAANSIHTSDLSI